MTGSKKFIHLSLHCFPFLFLYGLPFDYSAIVSLKQSEFKFQFVVLCSLATLTKILSSLLHHYSFLMVVYYPDSNQQRHQKPLLPGKWPETDSQSFFVNDFTETCYLKHTLSIAQSRSWYSFSLQILRELFKPFFWSAFSFLKYMFA